MKKNETKVTSTVRYLGDLRCEGVHLQSGERIISDAPVDNNGRGMAFSPTDLVATALAQCVITILGIKARDMDIDLGGTKAEVTKIMASHPRRIAEVHITFQLPLGTTTSAQRKILEKAGRACPVAQSLNPDLEQHMAFVWS